MTKDIIRVRYINILFAIYMASLIGCSIFFYYRIKILEQSFSKVSHTIDVKLKLEQTLSNLRDAETEQRGYLLTNDSFFLEHYNESRAKTFEKLAAASALTVKNTTQQNNIETLRLLIEKRFTALEYVMDQKGFNTMTALERKPLLIKGKSIMDEVRKQINKMKEAENELLVQRTASKEEAMEKTPLYVLAILVFSILVLATCYIVMQRYRLRQTVIPVA